MLHITEKSKSWANTGIKRKINTRPTSQTVGPEKNKRNDEAELYLSKSAIRRCEKWDIRAGMVYDIRLLREWEAAIITVLVGEWIVPMQGADHPSVIAPTEQESKNENKWP
jgi:hypothetical protein